jgi:integrase
MRRQPNKRRLSEFAVRQLRPRDRAYLVWDARQAGLAIKIERSGRRSWYCIYRHRGRPRWYRVASASAVGLADARRLAAKIMLQVAEGKDPQAERMAQRDAGTLAELAERYVNEHAKQRNKSWAQADRLVKKYLLPKWGKLDAKTVARADVLQMMSRIKAPVLANQVLAAASAVFSWAVKLEIVPVNPCRGVERNQTRGRERVLGDGEVGPFWRAMEGVGLRGMALRMILLTGARPGEVARMRREHIKDGWWTLPGLPDPAIGWCGVKNGRDHRVWLSRAARDIIAEVSDGEAGFVFEDCQAVNGLTTAMREICKQLGAERCTPHDLRRTFGTTVVRLGFGRDAMNRLLNHSSRDSVGDVYDRHRFEREDQQIVTAVADHVLALVAGKQRRGNVVRLRSA